MATFWQAVVTAAFVLAGIVFTQWQIRKAADRAATVEDRKVDAEAYERAREFDQSVVNGIKDELTRAKAEVIELRNALEKERTEHFNEVWEFRRKLRSLEDTIDRLRSRLRQAGIEVGDEPAV